MTNKFYAVQNGRKCGVFTTWEDCKEQVHGFANAKYKSFSSQEDAQQFVDQNALKRKHSSSDGITDINVTDNDKIVPPNKKLKTATTTTTTNKTGLGLSPTIVSTLEQDGTLLLMTDGASRGNPGLASCGAVLYNDRGEEIDTVSTFLGDQRTNNDAEYHALIFGLEMILERHSPTRDTPTSTKPKVRCLCDSMLLVRHLGGDWDVKQPNLVGLVNDKINPLIEQLDSFSIDHVRREHNKRADQLANHALDSRQSDNK